MKWILTGGMVGLASLIIGLAMFLVRDGGRSRIEYPRSTPEEALESAWAMVRDRNAERLSELLYSDSDEMRAVLARLGRLFGNLQALAAEINEAFPEEVAQLRANALRSDKGLEEMFQESRGRGRQGAGGQMNRQDAERASQELFRLLLADPFGWIERNRERVTAIKLSDDTAAVQVDGKPAMGIGMLMKRSESGWQIELPLNVPMVTRYLPRNREEWEIVASMIQVFDNAVLELRSDVRGGRASDVQDVAKLAGEKSAVPVLICFIAYNRAMEAREREGVATP